MSKTLHSDRKHNFRTKDLQSSTKKRKDIDNEIRVLKLLLSIQENEAKKYNWVEGTKAFDKIQDTRDKLHKGLNTKTK
jgi:hypothetical protein